MQESSTMNEAQRNALAGIKVVSFDLDDTLWDLPPVIERAEATLYRWIQTEIPAVGERYDVEQIRQHRMGFVEAHPELRVDMTAVRTQSLAALFEDCGEPAERAEEAFAVFYHARSQVELFHDAIPTLERIREHYSVSALTNGNADLDIVGIKHLFDDIWQASLSVPPKPHSSMFHSTAEVFSVDPSAILHVGDNPITDVQGGNDAGALTVWYNATGSDWTESHTAPDFEITNLTELLQILPALGNPDLNVRS